MAVALAYVQLPLKFAYGIVQFYKICTIFAEVLDDAFEIYE